MLGQLKVTVVNFILLPLVCEDAGSARLPITPITTTGCLKVIHPHNYSQGLDKYLLYFSFLQHNSPGSYYAYQCVSPFPPAFGLKWGFDKKNCPAMGHLTLASIFDNFFKSLPRVKSPPKSPHHTWEFETLDLPPLWGILTFWRVKSHISPRGGWWGYTLIGA